ncbi:MAG TPA: outer membrane beta-barrel protein [Candidatus Krumholzibacteria bacterium]|nr:outer membrane beta-barrel protein [Candidatus Krumholzibacteria bacterium]
MSHGLRRGLVVAALALAARPVDAGAAEHTRNGVCAGVGFGIESVSWTQEGDRRPAEGSGTLTARVGFAVKPDLVLGVEFWGWSQDHELSTPTLPVPVNVKLTATNACASFFPGNTGVFLRFGLGLAYGRVKQEPPPSVTNVPAVTESRTGVAFNFSPGYEWRVAPRLALGAQGDIVYLGLGDVLKNAFGYGLSAQFNWYW